jgi:pyruvate formate lyase activating enzyme
MPHIGPTPTSTLRRAREIGKEAGLHYVYEGNIPGSDGENTECPSCGCELVSRYGFHVTENRAARGVCPECQAAVAGVWHLGD